MIPGLDTAVRDLLRALAPDGSELAEAEISFEIPDADWRGTLETLTLNCYLYRVHENAALRRAHGSVERLDPTGNGNGDLPLGRRPYPPVPIDCSYCLTAWSTAADGAALEEHQLLSDTLSVLLTHRVRSPQQLWSGVDDPLVPYPVVRAVAEDLTAPSEFWTALEHPVKPSLNCVFTVAFRPLEPDGHEPGPLPQEVAVHVSHQSPPPQGSAGPDNG